ncbi:MAG: hypothetical protein DCC68_01320 [Planctomycetota bacterium]|nr:MAG: hypothetical protein DCC68_01320 [Planctomycetota bacterium]
MRDNMVTLRPAYAWDCEECGRENFSRSLIPEFSEEDLQELRDEHGVQPWETGAFVSMPESVKCPHCGAVFGTRHLKDA